MKRFQFEIDFRTGVPITAQIVEEVQSRLRRGELAPRDQLPTVRQLASDLRVNFNTVARAYRILDDLGLISTQQGRGTYILNTDIASALEGGLLTGNSLEAQIEHFFASLKQQGYRPEDVVARLEEALQSWREGSLLKKLDA